MDKKIKLTVGQNLRYTGKIFPGYIKGLPYMTFIAYHSSAQSLVNYSGMRILISTCHAVAI